MSSGIASSSGSSNPRSKSAPLASLYQWSIDFSFICVVNLSIIGIISLIYLYCDILSWWFRLGCQVWDLSHGRLKYETWEKIGLTFLGEAIPHFLISFCFCSFILVLVIEMKIFYCRYDTDFYILYRISQLLYLFFSLPSLEMDNGWDSTWHGTCLYSMAW